MTAWKPVGPDTPRDRFVYLNDGKGEPIKAKFRKQGQFMEIWDVPDKSSPGMKYSIINPVEWAETPE